MLQRLTLWARCPMHLRKYPFDSQSCPLELGSFSYTAQDVVYSWAKSPVSLDEVEPTQYKLTTWDHGVRTENSNRKIASGMRRDSVAFLTFDFEREMGFFILGIYFPLNLVVCCSWVAFWIVKTDVPARVALGVTTVLSVTKIGFGIKGKPQVGYSTALDIYIILCFIYTFAALTEFAIVNFIPKFVKRLKDKEESEVKEEVEAKSDKLNILSEVGSLKLKSEFLVEGEIAEENERQIKQDSVFSWMKFPDVKKMLLYEETQYVIDRMDEISR